MGPWEEPDWEQNRQSEELNPKNGKERAKEWHTEPPSPCSTSYIIQYLSSFVEPFQVGYSITCSLNLSDEQSCDMETGSEQLTFIRIVAAEPKSETTLAWLRSPCFFH